MKYIDRFMVKPGSAVRLDRVDAAFKDKHKDQASAQDEIERYTKRLRELQYLLYAEGKRSLLIILQAMDAGGKDGTINHVLGNMNPQGARVYGFKVPSAEEAAHDFLWRIHQATPQRGQVAIFNRSHYEDVLVSRVHGFVPKKVWSKRYDLINDFEKNLVDNNTHILKFYLHISEDEQLRRFKQRLDDPARHWKISESDYEEREYWDDYTKAFQEALGRCSTGHAPWFVIPANHKWFRNLVVSQIVVETLESLKMEFPKPAVDIKEVKEKYHKAEEEEAAKNGKKVRDKGRKKDK
ncbi:MAG: polyphosphate kinase 2 family protein [Oryzomonas sp.]|uniref:polyphosphate kinase 2 family protein n=1 Tax=Oryzomonas sp. TaxID=2855186 RepID=UPI002840652B|nr:polyphosphate kinase 2 family protein [Oryzomonas sp.]MDR3581265.1 polyphosphate kinase 2 family protein [Oryzomonas sp.]